MTNHSLFTDVPQAPADPILGITEKFNADKEPTKINLGVGVYQNEFGKSAKLSAVIEAEKRLITSDVLATYSPIDGMPDYKAIVQRCLFGANSEIINSGRAVTAQTPGGTGAIRLGADFLRLFAAGKPAYISDPSWDNHNAIFEAVGTKVQLYPYYNATTRTLDFERCFETLSKAPEGSIVVLHAACHNPTGYDFSVDQWQKIISLCETKNFIPFLDIAYQGFDKGFEEDAWVIKEFVKRDMVFLVASSYSKNFGLYAERIGALTIVTPNKEAAGKVQSQLKRIIRTIYSNPPARGAKIVQTVFGDTALHADWLSELSRMRERMKAIREKFVTALLNENIDFDFSPIRTQNGMFSYSGLSKERVVWLREHKHVYALESGRICIAAINDNNLTTVVACIAEAVRSVK